MTIDSIARWASSRSGQLILSVCTIIGLALALYDGSAYRLNGSGQYAGIILITLGFVGLMVGLNPHPSSDTGRTDDLCTESPDVSQLQPDDQSRYPD